MAKIDISNCLPINISLISVSMVLQTDSQQNTFMNHFRKQTNELGSAQVLRKHITLARGLT